MLYATLKQSCKERLTTDGSTEVVLPNALFVKLLRAALEYAPIDEDWYLEQNPDVREAVDSGLVASARRHYVERGYFENRLPRPVDFDEEYYASAYPDVLSALRAGDIRSLEEHFFLTGRHEGRTPRADFSVFGSIKPSEKSSFRRRSK